MARSFSYSGAGTVTTGSYGNPVNRGYIKVTGVTFNSSTGEITVSYDYGIYQQKSGSSALIAAVCVAFAGSLYDSGKNSAGSSSSKYVDAYMCHGYGTVTSQQGSNYVSSKSYGADSYNRVSGGSITFSKRDSLTYGVKAQMGQGWGWTARWNATSHPGYPNLTGGTLYFTYPQYDVTYDLKGGTGTFNTQTKDWGVALTLHSGKPTKSNTTATGYTVTFDGNGGTPSKTTATATDTTTHTFTNWSSGSSTYNAGASYTGNANLALSANYSTSTTKGSVTTATATKSNTTSTRKVTFNATSNGGSCSTASANSTATVSYSCSGWYAEDGTKRANAGAAYTPSSSETVTAQWSSSTGTYSAVTLPTATKANGSSSRTVTINANGGSSTVTSRTSTATITYSCSGWFTSASGGTKRGAVGGTYTPTAAETIYAQFTGTTGSYSAVTLPTETQCTRKGYKLLGFSTSDTATTATYAAGASYTPSATTTLYAVWELEQAQMYVKQNGTWAKGTTYVKVNGNWVAGKQLYTKVNDEWVLSSSE